MNDKKWHEFLNSDNLNCYNNLTQLSHHFKRLLDDHSRLTLSLFPENDPTQGVVFETGEGAKFAKIMLNIISSTDTWYLMLHCDQQPKSPEIFESLHENSNMKQIHAEASLIKLLPGEKGTDSIISVAAPDNFFQQDKDYNIIETEALEMASVLFKEVKLKMC